MYLKLFWGRKAHTLETVLAVVFVACICWNVWVYAWSVDRLPPRQLDELVVREEEYSYVGELLRKRDYNRGPIDFINNSLLIGPTQTEEDNRRFSQAQYVMVPWILRRNGRSVSGVIVPDPEPPFVIGDFRDSPPRDLPPDLVPIYKGPRIFLFERKRK